MVFDIEPSLKDPQAFNRRAFKTSGLFEHLIFGRNSITNLRDSMPY